MKPRLFFPILLAAMGLTGLMLVITTSAGLVVGQQDGATSLGDGIITAPHAITTPITLPWQAVVSGIDYAQIHLVNPDNNVYIARMHRNALSITLDTAIGSGFLADGHSEPVSQMAARYNQAINYWGQSPLTPTWGSRNDVVVAINGSYFSFTTTLPQSGMIQSGWYAKRFDDMGGGSGFAWKLDRSAFIGECVDHPDGAQRLTYSDGYVQLFENINTARDNHAIIIYTPQYDINTGTDDTGDEVVVQLSRPLLIASAANAVTGTVTAIYTHTGSTPIPFDSVVLSEGKAVTPTIASRVQVGDVISISQQIQSYNIDCKSPYNALKWGKTYASLGGAFYFLRNDVIRHFPTDPGATERLPRTAIVFNNDYIYFVVVDGRSWPSRGMSIDELALFARDTLSATYGISQDGGGSSTMVVNGLVKNETVCNNADCRHYTFLPLLKRPTGAAGATESVGPSAATQTLQAQPEQPNAVAAERYVANGLMMLAVQPMQISAHFSPTQEVKTTLVTDLRLGPGTNYAILAPNIPNHSSLVIVAHPLDGVFAKGSYWWKVEYNGKQGWVKESDLAPVQDFSR